MNGNQPKQPLQKVQEFINLAMRKPDLKNFYIDLAQAELEKLKDSNGQNK